MRNLKKKLSVAIFVMIVMLSVAVCLAYDPFIENDYETVVSAQIVYEKENVISSVNGITVLDTDNRAADELIYFDYNSVTQTISGISSEGLEKGGAAYILAIGDDVAIDTGAFHDLDGLVGVYFKNDCSNVAEGAFDGCEKLVEVSLGGDMPNGDLYGSAQFGGVFLNTLNICGNLSDMTLSSNDGFIFCKNSRRDSSSPFALISYEKSFGGVLTLPLNYRGNNYEIFAKAFYETDFYSLEIPASISKIGAHAFEKCVNLTSVEFFGADYTISEYAFRGCSRLKTVQLNGCLRLGVGAFSGCDSIEFAYLPTGILAEQGAGVAAYFGAGTVIVYENSNAYNFAVKENSSIIQAHRENVTYLIDINFHGYGEEEYVRQVLFRKGYNFVRNQDGEWEMKGDTALPVQTNYAHSVWYADAGLTRETSFSAVESMIDDSGTDRIDLYAKYLAPITVQGKTVAFSENAFYSLTHASDLDSVLSFEGADIRDGLLNELEFSAEIDGQPVSQIHDAGEYTLRIGVKDGEKYGAWIQDVIADVVVTPLEINVYDYRQLHFSFCVPAANGVDGVSDLQSGSVYRYNYRQNGEPQTYYSATEIDSAPDSSWTSWNLASRNEVNSSIVRYRANDFDHKIRINAPLTNGWDAKSLYEAEYSGEVSVRTAGEFTATAKLTASANYVFVQGTINSNAPTMQSRGLTVEIGADGKTANVKKVWYVVNYANALIADISDSETGEAEYHIPSWTFGDESVVNAPRLQHGDEFFLAEGSQPNGYQLVCDGTTVVKDGQAADGWNPFLPSGQGNDIVKFTLTRTYNGGTEIICESEVRSNWVRYFNKYMPVGKYTVTFRVSSVTISDHAHWWDNEIHEEEGNATVRYQGFTRSFPFVVYAGTFSIDDSDFNVPEGNAAPFRINISELSGGNFTEFFAPARDAVYSPVITREDVLSDGNYTYWADVAGKYYGEAPEMKFNLARMHNNSYLSVNDRWGDYIYEPSTYTVFYMAEILNYQTLPLMTQDRYNKYFTVIVYREIELPTLNRTQFIFTGRELQADVSAEVPDEERILYTLSGNKGTDAGDYIASFKIIDPEHYCWKNADGDVYNVPFTIEKAPVLVPELMQKVYSGGEQSADITIPTDYRGEPVFIIRHDTQNVDGKYIDAKTYDISLVLCDGANYRWVDTSGEEIPSIGGMINVPFTIGKAHDAWGTSVHLSSWNYGDYNERMNGVSGDLLSGRKAFFTVVDSEKNICDGLNGFTLDGDYAKRLNALPRGEYYIGAFIAESENYFELSSEWVKFEVLFGHNYWTETPNIIRWRYGEYDAEINRQLGMAFYGDAEFRFYRLDEEGNRIGDGHGSMSEFGEADDFNRIPCGEYEMMVTVDGGHNYLSLSESIVFRVLQGINFWEETPNIERWVYGEQHGVISGSSKYGEPVFTVTTLDGVEVFNSQTGKDELNAQRPGDYIMTAFVAPTANYTGLSNHTVNFRVFGTKTNSWRIVPNIQGWTEGDNPNAPQAEAVYGSTVVFTYRTADGLDLGETVPVQAGEYILVAYVPAWGDYNELTAEVHFTIAPRGLKINVWTVIPAIQGWTEGGVPNSPIGEALAGEVTFIYQKEDGTVLDFAPDVAGNYILMAISVADGYEDLMGEVPFTVASKVLKINVWTVAPNIQGWIEGEEANLPVGEAKTGEVQFIYRTADGAPLTGCPTVAGEYVLTATVLADGYETLTAEIAFTVTQALVKTENGFVGADGEQYTVSVDGVATGTLVTLTSVAGDGKIYDECKEVLNKFGYSLGAVYDIGLFDAAGLSIQPNGSVTVTLSVSTEYLNLSGLQVAHVGENGEIEFLGGVVKDGKITFTTTHFSRFCLVWADNDNGTQTILTVFLILFVALFALSVCTGAWYFLRVRQRVKISDQLHVDIQTEEAENGEEKNADNVDNTQIK